MTVVRGTPRRRRAAAAPNSARSLRERSASGNDSRSWRSRCRSVTIQPATGSAAHSINDTRILGLEIDEREAILAALEGPPRGLEELRATLLHEHVGRQRDGLV